MPEPSLLVKLDQLHGIDVGTKVRFLACIHEYDGQIARLTLRDRYPATAKDVPTAIVAIDNLLETLNYELLEVGSWVNIIGYIRTVPEVPAVTTEVKDKRLRRKALQATFVEATMLWSASIIRLEKYDAALAELQKASVPAG